MGYAGNEYRATGPVDFAGQLLFKAYTRRLDKLTSRELYWTRERASAYEWMRGVRFYPLTDAEFKITHIRAAKSELLALYRTALFQWVPYIAGLYSSGALGVWESMSAVVRLFEGEADRLCVAESVVPSGMQMTLVDGGKDGTGLVLCL